MKLIGCKKCGMGSHRRYLSYFTTPRICKNYDRQRCGGTEWGKGTRGKVKQRQVKRDLARPKEEKQDAGGSQIQGSTEEVIENDTRH